MFSPYSPFVNGLHIEVHLQRDYKGKTLGSTFSSHLPVFGKLVRKFESSYDAKSFFIEIVCICTLEIKYERWFWSYLKTPKN